MIDHKNGKYVLCPNCRTTLNDDEAEEGFCMSCGWDENETNAHEEGEGEVQGEEEEEDECNPSVWNDEPMDYFLRYCAEKADENKKRLFGDGEFPI